MELIMIQNTTGIIPRFIGEVITYNPWFFVFQEESEQERVKNGLFVHCYGHGEFELLREGIEVQLIKESE